MGRRKKYRKRSTKIENTKIGWLIKTDRKISDYTYVRPAIKYIFSKKENVTNVIKAIEKQQPGFFTDVQFNENLVDIKTNKDKLIDYVTERIETAKTIYEKRGKHPSIRELIEGEFRTEGYLSREERFAMNLDKIFSQRTPAFNEKKGKLSSEYLFKEERNIFKESLGTTNLKKADIIYLDRMPNGMPLSPNSMNRGYVANRTYQKKDQNGKLQTYFGQVYFETVRDRVGETEYEINLVVRYQDEMGTWHTGGKISGE